MPRFTSVKLDDLDKIRRMPRLGKVRLGLKVQKGRSEYPREVDYFVLPPEVLKKLGIGKPEEVKELDIMFPAEDLAEVFPVRLAAYKSSGLFCEGDGTEAVRREKGQWVDHQCPCPMLENGDCKKIGTLNVVLPKYGLGGCFQIVTSSWNSIVDINSGIDHVRKMVGRISWVPLKLVREPTETSHYDKGKDKSFRQTHFTLKVIFPYDIDFVNRLKLETSAILAGPQYRLPAPPENPYDDPIDLIEEDDGSTHPAGLPAPKDEAPKGGKAKKPAKPKKEKEKEKEKPEPVDAERAKPGEGDDAKPAEAAAPEAPPQDEAPADEPEGGAGNPPATMSDEHAKNLYKAAQLAFRKDTDRAKGFFKFFVQKYVGVEKSTEVPFDYYTMHHSELIRISEIAEDAEWQKEIKAYVDVLKEDAKARIQAARKAAGTA